MYGELTDKETVSRLDYTLENQLQDQFEVLLYKNNSKSIFVVWRSFVVVNNRRRRWKRRRANLLLLFRRIVINALSSYHINCLFSGVGIGSVPPAHPIYLDSFRIVRARIFFIQFDVIFDFLFVLLFFCAFCFRFADASSLIQHNKSVAKASAFILFHIFNICFISFQWTNIDTLHDFPWCLSTLCVPFSSSICYSKCRNRTTICKAKQAIRKKSNDIIKQAHTRIGEIW